jgi:hypothetical protein
MKPGITLTILGIEQYVKENNKTIDNALPSKVNYIMD